MASLVGVAKAAARPGCGGGLEWVGDSSLGPRRRAASAKIAAPALPCDYLLSPLISGAKPAL